mmetsp:Transcript_64969/g.140443  ORF Transcript_64969/g.140443 Transcript_64969/m.140443 type:complete len:85 (+) Transcript_64969:1156-1410(+)|eukprot:CAMPEP_0116896248 /NCGR_PEP_ID=MMETSP0467-20121206/5541_1 /TAXON_ID=283647 /ORGANISM="Mesodinium pulex, Strain SPMC105" /LENGTH=84 /DNA_ID=CAMNT_0004567327 /DNA_START=1264 /DNA_END=1518 /DNA_ORIENTATION=-
MNNKDVECDVSVRFKTLVVKKEKIRAGRRVDVELKCECSMLILKDMNSVEAFLLKKQKGIKKLNNIVSLNKPKPEEMETVFDPE